VVITRLDWRINGDLLQWICLRYPGLTDAQYEAGYRLLADPDVTDVQADAVCELLRGCCQNAARSARIAPERPEKEG
jgi:hypothetical protein